MNGLTRTATRTFSVDSDGDDMMVMVVIVDKISADNYENRSIKAINNSS